MDSKPQNVDLQTLDQEAELQSYTHLCNPKQKQRHTENHKNHFSIKSHKERTIKHPQLHQRVKQLQEKN